jgi:hypothetical protein
MSVHHLHYSPYQHLTVEQTAIPHKKVVSEIHLWNEMCLKRHRETRDLGATLKVSVANLISSRPNAFISPNPPDVMRQSKSVFGF